MMTADAHLASMLQRVEALLDRALNDDEVEAVLLTVVSWHALLAAGFTPAAVVTIAKQEAETNALH